MTDLKSGWKTSEFWMAILGKLISGLALLGIVNTDDAQMLGGSLGKVIGAVFVVIVNAKVILSYLKQRVNLKTGVKAGLLLLLLLGAVGPASAQILPFRKGHEDRIRQLETQIAGLNARPQVQPQAPIIISPPAPAAPSSPQIIMMPYNPGPAPGAQQNLPIPGTPQQNLPIPGAPQQNLPVPGAPQQNLPLPGTPQQNLPGPGAPQQNLPIQGPISGPPSNPPPPPAAPPLVPSPPTPAAPTPQATPAPAPPSGGWPAPQQSLPVSPNSGPQHLSRWTNCLYRPN